MAIGAAESINYEELSFNVRCYSFISVSLKLSSNKKYLKGEPGQRRAQQGYEARLPERTCGEFD